MAKNKNIKAIPAKNGSVEEQCQELVNTFEKMIEDRDAKLKAAKEQLVENLLITSSKYQTATGVMEALRVLQRIHDGIPDGDVYPAIACAQRIASNMSELATMLATKADTLGYAEMDKLCDGAYVEEFSYCEGVTDLELAEQIMILDLCRNVGPAAEDMVGFIDRVEIDLAETMHKLDELDPEWDQKYKPIKE